MSHEEKGDERGAEEEMDDFCLSTHGNTNRLKMDSSQTFLNNSK